MDVRGGCCVARYAGNAYDDLSRMDRIMLRFRPIAPKPVANSSGSGSSSAEKSSPGMKGGRGKRRYVRNNRKKKENSDGSTASVTNKCKNKNRRKAKSSLSEENASVNCKSRVSGEDKDTVVTLSLLPETPDGEDSRSVKGFCSGDKKDLAGINFGSEEPRDVGGGFWMSRMMGMVAQPLMVVGTWVHVECITETWVKGCGYGGIGWVDDRGMLMDLDRDMYPGFVSYGLERVVWVNRAYREMAATKEEEEVLVWLMIKEGIQLPPESWPGFTCSVRVVTCGQQESSRTLRCDVWRLEGGRVFAWRLDVKAALSLGL